jgi:D-erythronate 2-dehydrogenase
MPGYLLLNSPSFVYANESDSTTRSKEVIFMKILVIGAAGMLGAKLVNHLCKKGDINGHAITKITRQDIVLAPAPPPALFEIETDLSDLSQDGQVQRLMAARPDVIFHLAAIVSGEAEQDFEKGYRINFDGTRNLLEATRLVGDGYCPKFIFTSSIAVFGAPFPEAIDDEFFNTPLTSYGTQKTMGELLVSDYSRRGFLDGLALRMPTICVRPGKANKAASSFFSNIIREPLNGMDAILPVSEDVRHWHCAPRTAVQMLVHAAELDTNTVGPRRALSMPGVSCTVGEQIEALRKIGGASCLKFIRREPDPFINKIVTGWPRNFNTLRSLALGFQADKDFETIIRIHIEDEMKS